MTDKSIKSSEFGRAKARFNLSYQSISLFPAGLGNRKWASRRTEKLGRMLEQTDSVPVPDSHFQGVGIQLPEAIDL